MKKKILKLALSLMILVNSTSCARLSDSKSTSQPSSDGGASSTSQKVDTATTSTPTPTPTTSTSTPAPTTSTPTSTSTPVSTSSSTVVTTSTGEKKKLEKTPLTGVTVEEFKTGTPTKGNQPILVIPVEFTDKTFTDSQIEDIKKITSGNGKKDTKYSESLATFYKKSSYGQLNLSFIYADKINMEMTAEGFFNYYRDLDPDGKGLNYKIGPATALSKGVEAYRAKVGNEEVKKLDVNNDGYIESVIMVYPEQTKPSYSPNTKLFWNYRYWAYSYNSETKKCKKVQPNKTTPVASSFVWFSYTTLHKVSNTTLDFHVLAHEFGHMLGINDYYNKSDDVNHKAENPSGSKHMMANDVLDHDAVSKLQYGWVSPYYVTEDMEITINSHESSGDVILLADENGWNGSAFDEYVAIELFTPTGLNELDSKNRYTKFSKTKDSGYTNPGIRIWHADTRLYSYTGTYDYDNNIWIYNDFYVSDDDVRNDNIKGDRTDVAARNNYDNANSLAQEHNFKALSLVSARGHKFTSKNDYSTDQDLFHEHDVFSLSTTEYQNKYSDQAYFTMGTNKLNNGNVFPWSVEVLSIDEDQATLKITKTA